MRLRSWLCAAPGQARRVRPCSTQGPGPKHACSPPAGLACPAVLALAGSPRRGSPGPGPRAPPAARSAASGRRASSPAGSICPARTASSVDFPAPSGPVTSSRTWNRRRPAGILGPGAERRCNGPGPPRSAPAVDPRAPPMTGGGRMGTAGTSGAIEGLRALLGQRIVVLDGAWGTMLQGAGLAPADYRGDRLRDHPQDVTGDPDLLNLTRPDVVLDVAPAVPGRGRGHHHHQHLHRHQHRPGRLRPAAAGPGDEPAGRPAGPAGGRRGGRPVRGRLGRAAERHPVAVAAGGGPGLPGGLLRPGPLGLRGADPGAGRGRRRPAADRDDLRHAERQGRDRGRPRGRPAPAAVDLGDDRRPAAGGPCPGRPSRRSGPSIEHAEPAGRRGELLAGRGGDAPARDRAVAAGRHLHGLPPQRRPARTRSAATTRRRRRPPGCSPSSRPRGWSTSSAAAAGRRRRTSTRSPRPWPAMPPRAAARGAAADPVQRPGALRDRPATPGS